jgi:hypothetical protein
VGGELVVIELEVGNQDVHLFTNRVVPEESGVTPFITMCLVVTHPSSSSTDGFFCVVVVLSFYLLLLGALSSFLHHSYSCSSCLA